MMWRTSAAIILATSISAAGCGSTAPSNPVTPTPSPAPAPAPEIPSLVGEWRSTGNVTLDEAGGWKGSYSCPGSVSITAQTGSELSGGGSWQGNGFNGDRYCAYSGQLSGVVNADGTVVMRSTP